MSTGEVVIWKSEQNSVLISAKKPEEMIPYARQLTKRDQQQILVGFQAEHYEMALNYVWTKAMAALKRELGSVGMAFIGEMLDRRDISDGDDPIKEISDGEAIRLAEQLGVISTTGAVRLRNAFELISHFGRIEAEAADAQSIEMEHHEALAALKACIANILGREQIKVAQQFSEFRSSLETITLTEDHPSVQTLLYSPYFYRKLSIDVLCAVVKTGQGATLEHALANINTLLPLLWASLEETERWKVGSTYAEMHNQGREAATIGIKKALLKVKGFDYVPENIRSNTYIAAAERLLKAHESYDNFYNEPGPAKEMEALGTTIPTPAVQVSISAMLCVFLGNRYGHSFGAGEITERMLQSLTSDRWEFFLSKCLPTDVRVLSKLSFDKSIGRFCDLIQERNKEVLNLSKSRVSRLLDAAIKRDSDKVRKEAESLLRAYYEKKA